MKLFFVKLSLCFWFFSFSFLFLNPVCPGQEKKMFPASLVSPGVDGKAILVEKSSQRIFLYESKGGRFYKTLEFQCSSGEVKGPKSLDGDKKTPEGIYFLENEYEDRYLAPIYGKKAFTTDYPNFLDKKAGRNGSAIWIHGTNKELKPRDSNGCIAMNNKDILELGQHIELRNTPVVIVKDVEYADADDLEFEKQKIDHMLFRWIDSMNHGEYHDFLSFYSPDYLPDVNWWMNWRQMRQRLKEKDEAFSLHYDLAGIFRGNEYYVVFIELKIGSGQDAISIGRKKLFMAGQMDEYGILGDFFHTRINGVPEWESPLIFVADQVVGRSSEHHAIRTLLDEWLSAWSSEDIDTYSGFYHKDFYSDGMNRAQWMAKKRRLASKYDYIRVTGSDFKIRGDKNRSVVTFLQDYKSSNLNVRGIKTLVLLQKGERWKIYRENWNKR